MKQPPPPFCDDTDKLKKLNRVDGDWCWAQTKQLLEQSLVSNQHIMILINRLEALDKNVVCNGCKASDLCRLGRPCGVALYEWSRTLAEQEFKTPNPDRISEPKVEKDETAPEGLAAFVNSFVRCEVLLPHSRVINGTLYMLEPMMSGIVMLPDDAETSCGIAAGLIRIVPSCGGVKQ